MASKKSKSPEQITPIGRALTRIESPAAISMMIKGLAILCLLLFLADFLHLRHGKFESEDLFGFYGFFGFAAFAFIIFATKVLKGLIGREEDYYGPSAVDSEEYPPEELEIKEHRDV